ncbi:MAG TPA: DUF4433 domain-containing protein [Tepidiformaceae bacterium]|nr:DUF4433 domain-containing protein [Tepidiformaceae bacterium]
MHVDNLADCLDRAALNAPHTMPHGGRPYRTIHDAGIQRERHMRPILCGQSRRHAGLIHDYVAFYFGVHSPMLLQLKTGQVEGYSEGQEPLIYLVSTAQAVEAADLTFVFSDGQGIAKYTSWFDDLADLAKLDWPTIRARIWRSTVDDPDRQRRKQAEFLVKSACPWRVVAEIGVYDDNVKSTVDNLLASYPAEIRRPVQIRRNWYYP